MGTHSERLDLGSMRSATLEFATAVINQTEKLRAENEKICAKAKAEVDRARRLIDEIEAVSLQRHAGTPLKKLRSAHSLPVSTE